MHDVVDYIHLQGEELSYANYTRWESGNTFPGVKTHLLKTIAELFQKNGLKVESNWILTGEGFPPQFTAYTTVDEDTLFILASRTIPDVELIQIGGKYGEPFVCFGEFILVSNESDIVKNNGKLCYVRKARGILIGIMSILDEETIVVTGDTETHIRKSDVKECRKIKWIQKK